MKKDVLINIRGVYSNDSDRDEIEIFTTGEYYKKNGNYFITYKESEATGFDGSVTTLEIDSEKKVTLKRSGKAATQLIIERGVRHQCNYNTGYGSMMIGINGNRIKSTLSDKGGDLEFKYSMDINAEHASENEMYINVKES